MVSDLHSYHIPGEELAQLEHERIGSRYDPLPPEEMARVVGERTAEMGFPVRGAVYSINPKRTQLIGVVTFDHVQADEGWGVVAYSQPIGQRCGRGMWFAGGHLRDDRALLLGTEEAIAPVRRQTRKVDFAEEVQRMVTEAVLQADRVGNYLLRARQVALSELQSYRIVGEVLVSRLLTNAALVRSAYERWIAGIDDPAPHSLWSIHLAYLQAVTSLPPSREVTTSLAVGRYFTELLGAAEAAGAL